MNGHVEADEWSDARTLLASNGYRVLHKSDARYLYLAVGFSSQKHTGADLQLAAESGERVLLHVSSACGLQRQPPGGDWSERSWSTDRWACNPVGMIAEDGKSRILAPDGFEFQIERSLLPAGPLKLRLELKRPAAALPEGSGAQDTAGWVRIDA